LRCKFLTVFWRNNTMMLIFVKWSRVFQIYHIDYHISLNKKFLLHVWAYKILNECGANIYRCFKYEIKNYLIKTLHWCWCFENSHGFSKIYHFENSLEFSKFYRINFLIYVHKDLFMHIQAHKICNGYGANFERYFAYKIKSYSIETQY